MLDIKRMSSTVSLIAFLAGCSVNPASRPSLGGPGGIVNPDSGRCGTESSEIIAKRAQNFDNTLHSLLLKQTCVTCHDGKSGKAPFPHSSTDLSTAYQAAVQLVNLMNASDSKIVKKIQADHNCGSDAECQVLANSIKSKIGEWATLESTLPPAPQCAGDLVTGLTLTVPAKQLKAATLPFNAAVSLRWDLGALDKALGKMWLSVDVSAQTAPSANSLGNYQLKNLILASQDLRVKVLSVTPIINGRRAVEYANYAALNYIVDQKAFDPSATLLSQAPLSNYPQQLNWEGATDELGFLVIVKQTTEAPSITTQAPGCRAYDKFQLAYNNVFDLKVLMGGTYVGQCTRCHGDPQSAAKAVMDFSGNNGVDACGQALTRANFEKPLTSLLLTKPSQQDETAAQNTGTKHPVKIDLLSETAFNAQKSLIVDWINSEAKAAGY